MNNVSLTQTGILVSVIGTLLMRFGFSELCSNELIANAPLILGSITAFWGRMRQGDLKFGLIK